MSHINFSTDNVLVIIDDMLSNLQHNTPAQACDFIDLPAEQRTALISQLLLFFDCRQRYDSVIAENNIQRIAELISQQISNDLAHELYFKTSGSTGEPLLHKHTLFALHAEVMSFMEQAADIKRVVSVVPRYHLYGCSFAFLMPLVFNIPVKQITFLSVGGIVDELCDGDLLVGFPLFWQHLCALQRPFKQNVYGLTSTGPCPPRVFDELTMLGINRLYEIYGSSETGAAGLRCHYQDSFKLLAHWQRYDENTVQRATVNGVCEKVMLPDNVLWSDERHFRLVERKDKAIQVGGSNVYPRQIATFIETHPAIKLCRVRLMDEGEGNRLKAFVIPYDTRVEISALRNELIAWCRQHLAPAQRPKSFTFGQKLPVNKIGKEINWPIV